MFRVIIQVIFEVAFLIVVMFVSLAVVTAVGSCVSESVLTDASGHSLDYAGNLRKCPYCRQGIGYHQKGHTYRCDDCDRTFMAWLVNSGRDVRFSEAQ